MTAQGSNRLLNIVAANDLIEPSLFDAALCTTDSNAQEADVAK